MIDKRGIPSPGTEVLDSDGLRPPHERSDMKSTEVPGPGSFAGPTRGEVLSHVRWVPIEDAPRRYEQEFLLSGPSGYVAPHDRFVVTGFRREGCGDEWYDVCGDRLSDRGWVPDSWSLPPHRYEPPDHVREALDLVRELERARGNDYRVTDRLKDLIGKLGGTDG